MEPGSDQAPAMVQLGWVEVDPTLLDEPVGNRLDELLGPPEGLDVRVDPQQWAGVPRGGWRRVHHDELPTGMSQVLAAPHPTGGWVLVNVVDRGTGEGLLVSADPEPVHVHPGRAARRASLELRWPAPVAAAHGVMPELHVELTNTAARRWINHAGDRVHIGGWVRDLAGERVAESSPWVLTSGMRTLPDLETRQSVELPVMLESSGIDQLPAGRYQLEAVLLDLDLHAEPAPLHLT